MILGAGAALGLSAVAVATQDTKATTPIPRVCWFSDYANARLSNKCTYRDDERRWYMTVDNRTVPADSQKLEVANLCLYFAGERCPE